MNIVRVLRTFTGLAASGAILILQLRWITPAAEQGATIARMYEREAEASHEFICLHNPLGDMIRGTSFETWLPAAQTLHSMGALLITAGLVYLTATWRELKSKS